MSRRRKRINKKLYTQAGSTVPTKAEAREMQGYSKGKGYSTRIIKEKKGYSLFIRKRR